MTTLLQLIQYLNANDCHMSYVLHKGQNAFVLLKAGHRANIILNEEELLMDIETLKLHVLNSAMEALNRRMR